MSFVAAMGGIADAGNCRGGIMVKSSFFYWRVLSDAEIENLYQEGRRLYFNRSRWPGALLTLAIAGVAICQ